jgi:AcrR family transcriptional regulator
MDQQNFTLQKKSPRQPVQSRSIQTRENIIITGERMFIQKGFHNVLADDIAREAGVSVGSFYSYFKDKRALFLVILDRDTLKMMAGIEKNLSILLGHDNLDIPQIINKTLEVLLETHKTYFPLFLQAQQMAEFDDEMKLYQVESDSVSKHAFEKILLEILPSLNNENLQAISYVVFYASEGIIHNLVTSSQTKEVEQEIINETTHLIHRYILAYLTE